MGRRLSGKHNGDVCYHYSTFAPSAPEDIYQKGRSYPQGYIKTHLVIVHVIGNHLRPIQISAASPACAGTIRYKASKPSVRFKQSASQSAPHPHT